MFLSCLLAGALTLSPADPTPEEWSELVGETVVIYDHPGNHFEGTLIGYDEEKDRLVLESDGNTVLLPGSASSLVPIEAPERIVVTEGGASSPTVQRPAPQPRPPAAPPIDPQIERRKGARRMGAGGALLGVGTLCVFYGGIGLASARFSSLCILCTDEEAAAANESARRRSIAPFVALSLGAAGVVSGTVLLLDGLGHHRRGEHWSLQPTVSRRGGGLSLSGRF